MVSVKALNVSRALLDMAIYWGDATLEDPYLHRKGRRVSVARFVGGDGRIDLDKIALTSPEFAGKLKGAGLKRSER